MGRPKKISSQELVKLTDEYYEKECYGDPRRLKFSKIGAFARSKGINVADYDFKRDEGVRNRIEELSKLADMVREDDHTTAYKTLDIESILKRCRTVDDITAALREMDEYWKKTCDYAQSLITRDQEFMHEKSALERKIKKLEEEMVQLSEDIKESEKKTSAVTRENVYLRKMLKTYLYPNLANELLREKGETHVPDNTAVKPEAFAVLIDGKTPSAFKGVQHQEKESEDWKDALKKELERQVDTDGEQADSRS